MSEIKGLRADERQMVVRIANLVDSFVVAQRNIANAGEVLGRNVVAFVPVPQNLAVSIIVGGVAVEWDAVDFDQFSHYEVQYATTSTFADAQSIQQFTNRVQIKGNFTTLAVRVRTVDLKGNTSEFNSSTLITVSTTPFDVDTDSQIFESRARLPVQPELLGATFSNTTGTEQVFTGVGGAVGPSPISFDDTSNSGSTTLRNQITYTLQEDDVAQQGITMGLPSNHDEGNGEGPREFQSFTGSFVDFFYIIQLVGDTGFVDVLFLEYRAAPHEQSGVVNNAAFITIKH
jgi:hypothetical protein